MNQSVESVNFSSECSPESTSVEDEKEMKELHYLRKLLLNDFTTFLLNNILMSVQFFENYDRNIEQLQAQCLSENNLEAETFKCFNADDLIKLISSNVTFKRKVSQSVATGGITEYLHPLRSYVTHRNVEVSFTRSSNQKKVLAVPPYYKLVAENCEDDIKEVSGFVNLVEGESSEERIENYSGRTIVPLESTILQGNENGTTQKKALQTGLIVGKNETFYYLEPKMRSRMYTLNAYRTLEEIVYPSAIPRHCFKEKEKQNLAHQRRTGAAKARGMQVRKMLISAAFKRHFVEVFMVSLIKAMNYEKVNTDQARFHYDRIILKKGHEIHHVIPVLELKEWPNCATDFSSDLKGKRNSLEWPKKFMQEVIKGEGCILLPIGYHEVSDEKNDYTLEWKIEFPKAEKYLLMHMMHAHIRCYIFALIMYKSFMEKQVESIHFGPKHIANLLFFLVQRGFISWPERCQGVTFIQFLNILTITLKKKSLRDFFVKQRNLYASTPQRVLHVVQSLLTRILENPVPYILKAIDNLKYREDFYPQLDCLKLYKILTVKDLFSYLYPQVNQINEKSKKRKKWVSTTKNGESIQSEDKQDSGKPEYIDEQQLFDGKVNTSLQRQEVLRIFIKQFIDIGIRSLEYRAINQSMFYLKHAEKLTILLREENVSHVEIQEYSKRIANTKAKCNRFIRQPRENISQNNGVRRALHKKMNREKVDPILKATSKVTFNTDNQMHKSLESNLHPFIKAFENDQFNHKVLEQRLQENSRTWYLGYPDS